MKKKKYSMAYKIYSEDTVNKYQKKIDLLGYKDSYSAFIFLNVRLVSSICYFLCYYIF